MTFSLFMKSGAIEASWSTAAHVENWSSLPEEGEVTTIKEEEKRLTSYYLTNISGERIQEYGEGDLIVLNIETLNRIGDSITVNLNDSEYNFKHGNVELYNDTIENYVISNDLEQIQLTVIEQK